MAQAIPAHTPSPAPGRVVNFPTRRPPRWRWAVAAALLAVLVAVGVLYATGQLTGLQQRLLGQTAQPTYQTATVVKGTVAEQVTATGPVAAAQTLPVTFKASGKLVDLTVSVGQTVKKGDVLARLDPTDLQAALDQASAALAQAEASFAKAQAGATPEQRAASQVTLENAQRAAQDAAKSAAASTASAQKDVEAAQVSVATSQTSLQAARDAVAAARAQMETKLGADRLAVENAQKALEAAKATVATTPEIQKQQLDKAKTDLWAAQISRDATCGRGDGTACASAKATVAGLETAVNTTSAQAEQTRKQNEQSLQQAQAAVDTAKAQLANDEASLAASVKTADNNVKAAEAAVKSAQTSASKAQTQASASAQSAEQSANTAQAQVKSAQASLAQTTAAPLKADLDVAAAQVASAKAAVRTAQNNLDAATLTAPIDGTVAAINGAVGTWVSGGPAGSSSGTSTTTTGGLITLVTLQDLQVTAQVNEADVGKVTVGDPVSFTVSAFPGKTFAGAVTQIQPTGTTSSNVVNFAVTSSIKSAEVGGAPAGSGIPALYPGMTATVTITTDQRNDVLLVPNSALSYAQSARTAAAGGTGAARPAGSSSPGQGGQSGASSAQGGRRTVMVLQGGSTAPLQVTTGLTDGTNTEVTVGLQEGQAIVVGQSGGATAATGTVATGAGTAQRTGTQSSNPLTGGGPVGGFAPPKP